MGHCRCGTETTAPDRFCPSCGEACGAQSKQPAMDCASKESSVKSEVFQQVERAMHGDDSAWGDIYENTYRYVYFLAFKFLRSEADAQDITQEVYIQVIHSISQLHSAEAFYGWLRNVILSKCNDLTKKKKPVLLGDCVDDEDGSLAFDDLCEICDDFIPDMALDNSETQRMILEIIDALPNHQRQVVMFYYYDDMTIDQIATLTACPTGTVKSRLNYARKQIKAGVEAHEKKGLKLYGASSLPILSMLLKGQAESMIVPSSISSGLAPILGQAPGMSPPGAESASMENNAPLAGDAIVEQAPVNTPTPTAISGATTTIAKAIAGILVGSALIGGGAMLANNQKEEIIFPPTTTISAATADRTKAEQPTTTSFVFAADGTTTDLSVGEIIEGIEEGMPDTAYFDTLNDYAKSMLYMIVDEIRHSDYQAAYKRQRSVWLQDLFKGTAFTGGFWFYPSDGISVRVERGQDGANCIYLFSGNDGDGDCFMSIIDEQKWIYVLAKTSYSGGVANDPFVGYVIDYFYETEKTYVQSGNLINGEVHGTVYEERDGEIIEISKPAWTGLWPVWPIR